MGQDFILKVVTKNVQVGEVISVDIGLFWTCVVVRVAGETRCGLAATLTNPEFEHDRFPAVQDAGNLCSKSGIELAALLRSASFTEAGVGLAAVNALLPSPTSGFEDLTAEDFIIRQGRDSRVAVIGHFPFIEKLHGQVRQLWVLEMRPEGNDLPASSAPEIIPKADIVAITSTTLINGTLSGILELTRPDTKVMLLGPSTPLLPALFQHNIHVLSGTIIEDVPGIQRLIREGATYRQLLRHGARRVTLFKESEF